LIHERGILAELAARGKHLGSRGAGSRTTVEYFRRFVVHPEPGTLVWPNGADFAPEFLRESIAVAA